MNTNETISTTPQPKKTSIYEWIPIALLIPLTIIHLTAKPGGTLSTLSLFIAISLIPGSLLRLLGKPSWATHRICFALSLVAFVLNNPKLRPDSDTLHKMLTNWHLVLLGFLASFTQPVWGALRTHRLLADAGTQISQSQTLNLSLIGTFFNIFLPGSTGGDAYRIFAIVKKYHGKLGPAIASITLDRILGLPALILVVGLGMLLELDFFRQNPVLNNLTPFISAAAIASIAFVTYLAFASKSGRKTQPQTQQENNPQNKISQRLTKKMTGWLKRLHDMVAANVKSKTTLPLALLYGFLSHLACIASCLAFGIALGVTGVPSLRYFLIVPMAMTINAIPGAPGGVGQGELAMATLLDLAHPDAGNAQIGVMVMLLFRLSNMVMGLLGGILYAAGKNEPATNQPNGSAANGD